MGFRIPAMPLTTRIWRSQGGTNKPPVGAPDVIVQGQLRNNPRTYVISAGGGAGVPSIALLLPKGTDVRGPGAAQVRGDEVECPAGSGRYYQVVAVDDVAKGFPNEYRIAIIHNQPQVTGMWPVPTP